MAARFSFNSHLLFALAAVGVAQSAGAPDLTLRLKKGDVWVVTSRQEFREPGSEEIAEAFVYRTSYLVIAVKAVGYEVEARTELLESRLGDDVIPPPKGAVPLVQQLVLGPNGERASLSDPLSDAIEFRLSRLAWFVGPGAAKATQGAEAWKVVFPADEGGRVPEATAQFRFVKSGETGGRRAHWFTSSLSESRTSAPLAATGTFVIDARTGLVLEAKIDAKNALLPGGEGQTYDLKIVNTTELKLKST